MEAFSDHASFSVKCKTQRQIIVDFYQKRKSIKKALHHEFFGQLRVTSNQVYHVIAYIECADSHLQKKGSRAPQKSSKPNGKQVVKAIEIKIAPILSLPPMTDHTLLFHEYDYSERI